ncbi:MAG: HPF/RaiA family ribosome-associated protein [Gemmatimonadota bacterium]
MRTSSREKKARQRGERRQPFAGAIAKSEKRDIGRSTTRQTPLDIRARNLELPNELMAYIARRVSFRLAKYGLHLTRITVRFENVGGPRGATECRCKFAVALPGKDGVVVGVLGVSPRGAFDRALDATDRAVRRLLGRQRQPRKTNAKPGAQVLGRSRSIDQPESRRIIV